MDRGISAAVLPVDHADALLAGRLWLDGGPTVALIRNGVVEDVSSTAPTMSDLLDIENLAGVRGRELFALEELFNLPAECLLSPVDLQVIKAAGVTFAISAIERVIEERARGDYQAAAALRAKLEAHIGGAIRSVLRRSAFLDDARHGDVPGRRRPGRHHDRRTGLRQMV